MKESELISATRFLAVSLELGLPLDEALNLVKMPEASEAVKRGDSLSKALSLQGDKLPDFYRAVVQTAEQVNRPEELLRRLSDWLETRARLLKRLKTALYYPMMVLFVTALQFILLLVFFLPVIVGPALRSLGLALVNPWWFGVLGIILGASMLLSGRCFRLPERSMSLLPALRRVRSLSEQAVWVRALSVLTASGLSLPEALERSENVFAKSDYLELKQMRAEVERGADIADAARVSKLDVLVVSALQTETALADNLLITATVLESEAELLIAQILRSAQPVALLLLSLPVLATVLLFWLPYLEISMNAIPL